MTDQSLTDAEDTPPVTPRAWLERTTPVFAVAFVVFGLIIAVGLSFSSEQRSRGHEFVTALREERFQDAFEMCSSDLQRHLKDVEGLERRTKVDSLPDSFWWTETKTLGNDAFLRSSMRTWWSRSSVTMSLHREGDQWRVGRFSGGNGERRTLLEVPRPRK